MRTDIGNATKRKILAKGADQYLIEGKKYTFLLNFINDTVPHCYRTTDGWYGPELRNLLILLFPHWYKDFECIAARAIYMKNYPDVYEHIMQVNILPTKLISEIHYKNRWFKKHKNQFIEIYAWDDTDPNVCEGEILIKAALEGDIHNELRYFTVPKSIYESQRSDYGFVCVSGLHEEVDLDE